MTINDRHELCIEISEEVGKVMAKYFMVYGIPVTASLELAKEVIGECKHNED